MGHIVVDKVIIVYFFLEQRAGERHFFGGQRRREWPLARSTRIQSTNSLVDGFLRKLSISRSA